MVSAKGKEKASDSGGKGKGKWSAGADDDNTGRKRKNRSGALRFFDDSAYEVDKDSDVSDDDDDMFYFGNDLLQKTKICTILFHVVLCRRSNFYFFCGFYFRING